MNKTWLAHHGIKGQKWGVRRFQNPDGSLTSAGQKRYGTGDLTPDRERKNRFKERLLGRSNGDNPITKATQALLNVGKPRSSGLVSTQDKKLPLGTIIDGPNKPQRPKGGMIDGYQKHKKPDAAKTLSDIAKERNKKLDKNRSSMSDKELNDAIDRLKKEKQLHDAIHPGEKYAKDIMSDVGKKVLVTAISGAALYGGKYFISKLLRKNGNSGLSDSDLDSKINHLRKINELNKLENPDFDAGDFADAIFNGGAKKKK